MKKSRNQLKRLLRSQSGGGGGGQERGRLGMGRQDQ